MTCAQMDDEMARGQPVYCTMVFGRKFLKETEAREQSRGLGGQ